jgi:tetratricopeptide (TPR) repeat protein
MEERTSPPQTFSTRAAARILALSPDRIRYWVRRRLLKRPAIVGKGYQFAFNDLLMMRMAKELLPSQRHLGPVRRCFERLGRLLTPERPLTSLKLVELDGRIVVSDGGIRFEGDSGQLLFGFSPADGMPRDGDDAARSKIAALSGEPDAEDQTDLARLVRIYNTMVEAEPANPELRMRLAQMLEQAGDLRGALRHYLHAATIMPGNGEAHMRLGMIHRQRDEPDRAVKSFIRALSCDPGLVECHRHLAELYEQLGRRRDALRHLSALHRLTRDE